MLNIFHSVLDVMTLDLGWRGELNIVSLFGEDRTSIELRWILNIITIDLYYIVTVGYKREVFRAFHHFSSIVLI